MRALAVDTTTSLGSTAIVDGDGLVAEFAVGGRRRHGEFLLGDVEGVLAAAGLSLAEIDLLAVGLGPGSFTGLRVGLASMKGLALATGLPLVGVGSLETIAAGVFATDHVVVPILDGSKGEVFAAAYSGCLGGLGVETVAPFNGRPDAVLATLADVIGSNVAIVVGSGFRRYRDVFSHASTLTAAPKLYDAPRASLVGLLARQRFEAEGAPDLATLEPRYLRGSDAKLP